MITYIIKEVSIIKKVRKTIIPLGGLGTRFLPATKAIPKGMLPVVDRPIIEYLVLECVKSGIEEIFFITNENRKYFENHFSRNFELEERLKKDGKIEELNIIKNLSSLIKITYINQDVAKGTGYAISLASPYIENEPVAILYGDDLIICENAPALKQLINIYEKTGANIIGVTEVTESDVNKYGIIEYDKDNKIKGLVEKPSVENAPSMHAIPGRFVVNSSIFKELDNIDGSPNGEFLFTDALIKLMKKEDFYACEIDGIYYDTGSKIGYLKANIDFALKRDDLKEELEKFLSEKD